MEARFIVVSLLGLVVSSVCGCQAEEPVGPTDLKNAPSEPQGSCHERPTIPACGSGDIADKDNDGDGLANCADPDIDGDGISNEADCAPFYALSSLTACDQGDLATKDYDGDGLANCKDPDIDGDGISNETDGDPYKKNAP